MKEECQFINPVEKTKQLLKSKKQSAFPSEFTFHSYAQTFKSLTQIMTQSQKQKIFSFFTLPSRFESDQLQQQKGSSSLLNSFESSSNRSKINKKQRQQIPSNHFISQIMNESSKSHIFLTSLKSIPSHASFLEDDLPSEQFTLEERQSLKNAFRYICRLIFKEASKYSQKMPIGPTPKQNHNEEKTQEKLKKTKSGSKQNNPLSLLSSQAEIISGERYFKHYLEKLSIQQKKSLLKYMIWFLKTKYLRYINKCNNENKGKRKQMKKKLYIRFKNAIMLPYLEGLLNNITSKDSLT